MDRRAQDLEERSGSGQGVQVERTLDVLELLADTEGRPVGLSEVAAELGQPKATTHRLLTTLKRRGYVGQTADSGYVLGIKCFELGSRWAQSFDIRAFARPFLEALNQDLGEAVHLAVYDEGDVVYIDKLESTQYVIARSDLGNRAPAAVVATGRALLAFQPKAEVKAQLSRPLPAYTPHTLTTSQEVLGMLDSVRRDGFAVNRETYRAGVCGLAAPIRDSTGAVVASVGILMPAHRFTDEAFPQLRDRTIRAALDISTALGGPSQLITTGG